MSMNFYDAFTQEPRELIRSIDPLPNTEDQPGFIHMVSLNGRRVAYLGEKQTDREQFINAFVQVHQMILPAYSRMVNTDVLLKQLPPLKPFQPNKDGSKFYPIISDDGNSTSIDTSIDNFFYEGKLTQNVLLDVANNVTYYQETKRHYQSCYNYKPTLVKKQPAGGAITLADGQDALGEAKNCPHGFDPCCLTGPGIRLPLFYVDVDDLLKVNLLELKKEAQVAAENYFWTGLHIAGTVQESLKAYFEREDLNPNDPARHKVILDFSLQADPELKGFFFMPMLMPDQRVIYLCLVNKSNLSNGAMSIKANLLQWFEGWNFIKECPEERELFIASADLDFAGIDQWGIMIGKNAWPVIIHKDQVHEEIRKSKIRMKNYSR